MERLRKHLGIERWLVFGGSWGSTLALAYAEANPDRVSELVLRGIFLLRYAEIRWFYQHGASDIFPDAWEAYRDAIPLDERDDFLSAYHRRLVGSDQRVALAAARAWSVWEASTSFLQSNGENIKKWGEDQFALAVARIECHYFVNRGFLRSESQLLDDVAAYPAHSGDDRAGTLRRRLPGNQRLGFASSVARGGLADRARCGTLGIRSRQFARTRARNGSVPQPIKGSAGNFMRSTQSALLAAAALAFLASRRMPPPAELLRFPDVWHDRIVFSYAGDLWTVGTHGGTAAQLTSNPGVELFAKFSPDGRFIAFTGQYGGDEQVYVIPADGGAPKQLTFYPAPGPLADRWGYDNQVYGGRPDGGRSCSGRRATDTC